MPVTYRGTPPDQFFEQQRREILRALNEESAELERSLVVATPSGVSGGGGGMRSTWSFLPANESTLTAVVGQSSRYFLPVEMGRKAGKGISKKGQQSVALWAKRKLGLRDERSTKRTRQGGVSAKTFAFLLSQKYKREGRPAVGFAGLAREGDAARSVGEIIDPVSGGIIDQSFQELKNRLNRI